MKTKHIIIVTGLSGAGKTTALNILEDMNYYTIDNLPLGLEKSLLDTEIEKLAVGIDIRTFKNTKDFFKFINFILVQLFKEFNFLFFIFIVIIILFYCNTFPYR